MRQREREKEKSQRKKYGQYGSESFLAVLVLSSNLYVLGEKLRLMPHITKEDNINQLTRFMTEYYFMEQVLAGGKLDR